MTSPISLFGMEIKVDDTMLDNKVKFVHPDGSEEVIDITDGKPRRIIEGIDLASSSPDTSTESLKAAINGGEPL